MIKKLLDFLKFLFSLLHKKKVETTPATQDPVPVVQPAQLTTPVVPTVVVAPQEPDVTDPTSQITSFLWKPLSDTNPKVTVITVSCDGIKSDDLYVEVLSSANRVLFGKKEKNPGSPRGNNLPGQKFGRINFKPGLTAETYAKSQPLKVRFYVMINKMRTDIHIQGKASAVIKDATVRWAMHGSKMVVDVKK